MPMFKRSPRAARADAACGPRPSNAGASKDLRKVGYEEGRARLSWEQRWTAIDRLQKGPTTLPEEHRIRDLLAGASVQDRAAILRRIDQNTDHHDVEELVYHDIDDPGVRAQVKALIAETSVVPTETGVISDFDDTAYPHRDKRYGKEFPGARAFYGHLEGDTPGDVFWVTARPELFAGKCRDRIADRGLPAGPVETGSLGGILAGGQRGIYAEKVDDIRKIFELHPAQRFVLIGDDTQQDPKVYLTIQKEFSDRVVAIFIRRSGHGKSPELPGIHYVDDYHQAMDLLPR